MRELVYYVAVSIDGYIAGPDGEFDAFLFEGDHAGFITAELPDAIPTHIADQLGIAQRRERFDTVLMGAGTYSVGLPDAPSPYRHLDQYLFTHRAIAPQDNLTVTAEDPAHLVRELKAREGADIWLCGGRNLAAQLAGEIDRLVLKRNPVVFGAGIPLFAPGTYAPAQWDRVRAVAFDSGVVLEEYVRRQE
ncbi:dihydrofolate reductase family protein [Dietzia timorensis]|uniref:Uncharacterized protein YwjB n=1 Tax=Dietzia timorensis TaxID=499555 RepID=A0A173LEW4_9ACTN|nr:dihydrofolate reductase family protein [Dietzia timorensis]ANI90826.1 Uncharacterized protein YwjB [Dietzia timorensis]